MGVPESVPTMASNLHLDQFNKFFFQFNKEILKKKPLIFRPKFYCSYVDH